MAKKQGGGKLHPLPFSTFGEAASKAGRQARGVSSCNE